MLTWPWDAVFQAAESIARPSGSPTLGKLATVLEALQRALSDEHDPAAEAVRELVAQTTIMARGFELAARASEQRYQGLGAVMGEQIARMTVALNIMADVAEDLACLRGPSAE
jgi:hypothetical protein